MNVVYAAQLRDSTGYAVAARGYLKALDTYLQKHPGAFNLKVYTPVIAESNRLSEDELQLLSKYEFHNDDDISDMLMKDYLFLWHMPPPLTTFTDERFRPSPGCSASLMKLHKNSTQNVNLTVWETDAVPQEWQRDYEYLKPDRIIVPCQWNKSVFENSVPNIPCDVVQHVIEPVIIPTDSKGIPINSGIKPINLPVNLADKFVVLTISQWTKRKGFDNLIKSFTAEFGNNEDAVLIIKTYGGPEGDKESIARDVKMLRHSLLMDGPLNSPPSVNNILLIPGFIAIEKIRWLYQQASIFALFSRGEGFGLPIAEAIMSKKPVMVSAEGGHVDYINPENAFFVNGHWDTCTYSMTPYGCDGQWFECHINSGREQLRKAYNLWKNNTNSLTTHGVSSYNYILNGKYSSYDVGELLFEKLKKTIDEKPAASLSPIKDKTRHLKKKLNCVNSLQKKVDLLKDAYKGETCYILNCGPSLKDYDPEVIKEKLGDKLVFAVKQAQRVAPEIVDFHFWNCANIPAPTGFPLLEHYTYPDHEPIVVASSNYGLGERWNKYQKHDIFFKIPIRTKINDEFVCKTNKFEEFALSNNVNRPCGPGIMYETVIFMAEHLGVDKIVAIGWDLSQTNPKNPDEYDHFYKNEDVFIKGDILSWEVALTCEASKPLYEWLQQKDIELELASDKSSLYEKIPRVKL
tara:strand:- start:2504 stop:4567 length:2064 start_codon:yes stop_codon:yes gene_type:complete